MDRGDLIAFVLFGLLGLAALGALTTCTVSGFRETTERMQMCLDRGGQWVRSDCVVAP